MLLKLFDHLAWADGEAVRVLEALPEGTAEREHAVKAYAHLAAAAHVWLVRLEHRSPVHAVWPDLSLAESRALADDSLAGLRRHAGREEGDLATAVEYRNSAGRVFRNTAADVLMHVVLHGSYHRGQLALLTRQGGGSPAATDYIAFVRGIRTAAVATDTAPGIACGSR